MYLELNGIPTHIPLKTEAELVEGVAAEVSKVATEPV